MVNSFGIGRDSDMWEEPLSLSLDLSGSKKNKSWYKMGCHLPSYHNLK